MTVFRGLWSKAKKLLLAGNMNCWYLAILHQETQQFPMTSPYTHTAPSAWNIVRVQEGFSLLLDDPVHLQVSGL